MEIQSVIKKGLDFFNIDYSDEILKNICLFVEELSKWNEHLNLTGIKRPAAIVEILVYDSFFVFKMLENSNTILDMGSGSGILAIPITILSETHKSKKVFSIDKSLRKIQFQRHIKRNLGLSKLYPIHSRVEILEPIGVDALIAKGYGDVDKILKNGGGHIKHGGKALVVKGKDEMPSDTAAGFSLVEEKPYSLPFGSRTYKLFVYLKT